MEGIQNVFTGISYIAYAMCMADGKIQTQELEDFKEIASDFVQLYGAKSSIIKSTFQLLESEKPSKETALKIGLDLLRKHEFYLDDSLKSQIIDLLEQLASAVLPIEEEEYDILDFVQDVLFPEP